MTALIPLAIAAGATVFSKLAPMLKGLFPQQTTPNLPGPTAAEVLASDDRLRRALAPQRGRVSTMVSGGGLAGSTGKVTMPSLVGV